MTSLLILSQIRTRLKALFLCALDGLKPCYVVAAAYVCSNTVRARLFVELCPSAHKLCFFLDLRAHLLV